MNSTRATLLIRIKDPRDTEAWAQFYELYGPLLYRYARARGLGRDDAEDIRSKCYEAIVRQINAFDYEKSRGGFKAWLRTLVNRRVTDLLRKRREPQAASAALRRIPEAGPTPEEAWERQWKRQHLRYCLDQIKGRVSLENFEAFRLHVLEDRTVEEVSDQLGINANRVHKAKSRILKLVRQKMIEIGYEDADS